MSAQGLARFMSQEQGARGVTVQSALQLIHNFEPPLSKAKDTMSLSGNVSSIDPCDSMLDESFGLVGCFRTGFTAMVNSPAFAVLKEEHRRVYQDMSQPLSHYYIASSHNT